MSYELHVGDCLESLKQMPDSSVHCCVTSPPYFGLRDYGVPGQLGLEPTPDEFVASLVRVFQEVRRVLRDDGTLWLNLGDSYASSPPGNKTRGVSGKSSLNGVNGASGKYRETLAAGHATKRDTSKLPGLKPKDLIGIPWMVAFALRADGWYLRQDIIWHKPNPMPESVKDRCTKAHEHIFLFSKSQAYYFDREAMQEPAQKGAAGSEFHTGKTGAHQLGRASVGPRTRGNKARKPATARGCPEGTGSNVCGSVPWEGPTRNKRSVWTVAPKPYKGAHFATFPPDLIEPCVLAGCPPGGVVLDPFGGSGTTAGVALKHGRCAILCELNAEYAKLVPQRVASISGQRSASVSPADDWEDLIGEVDARRRAGLRMG